MNFVFSSKVTSKLSSWSHSPGEVKCKFTNKLSSLFDFLTIALEREHESLHTFVKGDHHKPAIHYSKENNLIVIHDFDVHNLSLNGNQHSFPAVVNQKFFKNVKAANISSEKSLYAIGDLSTTSSKSVFPIQRSYPGSNSFRNIL